MNRRAGWLLCALLALAFLLGGGSRADIASLIVLRPLVAVLFVVALGMALRARLGAFAVPLGILGGWLILIALQLVPLPPALWTALPGRAVLADNYAALGLDPGWKPLTIGPMATLNSLQAMFAPLAVLMFYATADEAGRRRALTLFVALAGFSALFGIVQAIGGDRGWLYPYRVTNPGFPVGLFANRNHQAAMLAVAVPMLLALAETVGPDSRRAALRWAGRLVAIGFVAVAVMTGSRAGTMLALAGLVAGALLFGARGDEDDRRGEGRSAQISRRLAVPAVLLLGIAAMFYLATGTAFERLAEKDSIGDLRFQILPTIGRMIADTFPVGFGFGTFAEAYMIYEPAHMMIPSYINRAHDDWVEIVLEGGLPAAALALAMVGWAARRCWTLRGALLRPRNRLDHYRAAAVLGLVILLGASLFDYPLRTPAAACVLALLLGCLAGSRRDA